MKRGLNRPWLSLAFGFAGLVAFGLGAFVLVQAPSEVDHRHLVALESEVARLRVESATLAGWASNRALETELRVPQNPRAVYFATHAFVEDFRELFPKAAAGFGFEEVLAAEGSWGKEPRQRHRFAVMQAVTGDLLRSLSRVGVTALDEVRLEGLNDPDDLPLVHLSWLGTTDSLRRWTNQRPGDNIHLVGLVVEPVAASSGTKALPGDTYVALVSENRSRFTVSLTFTGREGPSS